MTRAIVVTVKDAASIKARLAHKPGASPASPGEDDTSESWISDGSQNPALFDGTSCFVLFARGVASPQSARNVETGAYPAATGSSTLTQVLYLQEAGNTAAISVTDINQGQIGDRYLHPSYGFLM